MLCFSETTGGKKGKEEFINYIWVLGSTLDDIKELLIFLGMTETYHTYAKIFRDEIDSFKIIWGVGVGVCVRRPWGQ